MSANSTVVAAGVSATLQLLRVVVDLVTVASQTAKRNEAKIENAKSPPSDADGKELERSGGGGRRFSVRNFDGRLSAVSVRGFGVSFPTRLHSSSFHVRQSVTAPGFFLAAESDERLKSLHLRNF